MRRATRYLLFWVVGAMVSLGHVAAVEAQIVQGRIVEELTERAISGAEVLLLADDGTVVATGRSGAGGRFGLAGPEMGAYRLQVVSSGYETITTGLLQTGATPLDLVVEMLPTAMDAVAIEGIEVTVDALGQMRQEMLNRGLLLEDLGNRFLDQATIDSRMGNRDIGAVIDRRGIPGLTFIRSENLTLGGSSGFLCATMLRGRTGTGNDRCALVLLDGRRVDWNTVATIPGNELKAIVVLHPTEATLVYGGSAGGGAVLMFTR